MKTKKILLCTLMAVFVVIISLALESEAYARSYYRHNGGYYWRADTSSCDDSGYYYRDLRQGRRYQDRAVVSLPWGDFVFTFSPERKTVVCRKKHYHSENCYGKRYSSRKRYYHRW